MVKYLTQHQRMDPYLLPDWKKIHKSAKGCSSLLDFFNGYVDPLHKATLTGDTDTFQDFVENKKWCPLMLDKHGNNTLHTAAKYGQLQNSEILNRFW